MGFVIGEICWRLDLIPLMSGSGNFDWRGGNGGADGASTCNYLVLSLLDTRLHNQAIQSTSAIKIFFIPISWF